MSHATRRYVVITILLMVAFTISPLAGPRPGEEELIDLLSRFEREPAGPAKDELERRVDAIAHQRYATISRLYWHTDLPSAQVTARKRGKPILHLRLLGRLDEELSCANSRLFRATLYANQDVSRFLREHFVLLWSSERPVPIVTIDFGNGRVLQRTTTGNSAHYVLDADGRVLDVLPGLYAPAAFRKELEQSLILASRVRELSDDGLANVLSAYHQQLVRTAEREWARVGGARIFGARESLIATPDQNALLAAQRATMSKASIEMPDLSRIVGGFAPETLPEDRIEMWSTVGRRLYDLGDVGAGATDVVSHPLNLLDDASRALVTRLHNAVPVRAHSSSNQLEAVIARLEQSIVADTALNQLRLRPQIAREIVGRRGRVDFESLNAWIYADVFRTPREDAWLGLLPRDTFTGLPGDGVAMKQQVFPRAPHGPSHGR